ncbi:MAG TPA: ABC transporter ATP-binding protein [Bryobacteraceae bacterium]|nr:ABC transporter ATP-binding protein [Bryobacteraceae bacterium]
MDAIRITNLVKRYGLVTAVDDLSLTVASGKMFGFLGPNGSGKSTTIGCLTGLLDPTSGRIEILEKGFDANAASLKRRMGVMPENLGLFEPLRAHEFLAFVGRMYGLDERSVRTRVTELLDALELTDASKILGEFSTGMRKRVAFAAAVIHSPDVLFLDEPFESIDPAGVALMKQWLHRYVQQGRTVFLTSHVLETVERLCQEVAIIAAPGKLVWQGDITTFGREGAIVYDGKEFEALEPLFLHLTGERHVELNWL